MPSAFSRLQQRLFVMTKNVSHLARIGFLEESGKNVPVIFVRESKKKFHNAMLSVKLK